MEPEPIDLDHEDVTLGEPVEVDSNDIDDESTVVANPELTQEEMRKAQD